MKCENCGIEVVRRSNRQRYCKKCAVLVHRNQKKHNQSKYRNLGTSSIKEIPYDDVFKEFDAVQKEKIHHGLCVHKCKNCGTIISSWRYLHCDYNAMEIICKKCGMILGNIVFNGKDEHGNDCDPTYFFDENMFVEQNIK